MESRSYTTDLWLRKWSLIVFGPSGAALAITQGEGNTTDEQAGSLSLRMVFEVRATDQGAVPNIAIVRVYNPSPQTAKKIMKEYSRMVLSAGYRAGRFGTIFDGQIKMVKYGKETPVDSFLDIYAADGDLAINNAVVNIYLDKSLTQKKRWDAIARVLTRYGVTIGEDASTWSPESGGGSGAEGAGSAAAAGGGPAQPRGAIVSRMWADEAEEIRKTNRKVWFVENGELILVDANGSRKGEVVVLNGETGLIGFPTQQSDGIEARMLLNPSIHLRQRVKIDNESINQAAAAPGAGIPGGALFPFPSTPIYQAPISADGTYTVLLVEHRGDTRGNDWFTEIVGWSSDPRTGQLAQVDGSFPTDKEIAAEDAGTAPTQSSPPSGGSGPGQGG